MPESTLPTPPAEQQRGLLNYEQVGSLLGVSERQVKRYVASKALKMVNLGYSTKRFRRADVERFIARRAGDRVPESY